MSSDNLQQAESIEAPAPALASVKPVVKKSAPTGKNKSFASKIVPEDPVKRKNFLITAGIILVVLAIIVVIILYMLWCYNPVLINGKVNARYPMDVESVNLRDTSVNFSMSFWFKVYDWTYRHNERKELLNWDNGKLKITLDPRENHLIITTVDRKGEDHTCEISDFKLQKWTFVSITLWNRSLDITIDNKYSHSCAQNILPDYRNSKKIELFGKEGFNGMLSNLYFYNYPVGPEKATSLYYKGPNFHSWFYWLIGKLQGKKLIEEGSE